MSKTVCFNTPELNTKVGLLSIIDHEIVNYSWKIITHIPVPLLISYITDAHKNKRDEKGILNNTEKKIYDDRKYFVSIYTYGSTYTKNTYYLSWQRTNGFMILLLVPVQDSIHGKSALIRHTIRKAI